MASSYRQQGNDHLKFSSNSPCFFKIIFHNAIKNGKLGIPRKFVKEHGHSMSSQAMLRVPSGEVRKVEVTKCDGKIWFEKGWLQFASHYSVDMGHLLVFRYDGNSNFHVTIFDKSATEIQYPHITNNSEDVDSIKILGNMSPRRTKRAKPHPSFNEKSGCPAESVTYNEKVKGLDKDENTFKFENSSFQYVMKPTHVGRNQSEIYRLVIPCNFAEKHLTKEHCSVILCNSGKTWIANIKRARIRNRFQLYLHAGWDTFVRDNSVQVGDVCSFELINSIQLSFKVVIQKCNAHSRAAKSENPFFSVVLKQSYANYSRLVIPVNFARQHLKKMQIKVILLLSNGRSWPVKYYEHYIEGPKPFVIFGNGWRRFAEDNNLEAGDVCRFELSKGAETSMNVTVTKKPAVEV